GYRRPGPAFRVIRGNPPHRGFRTAPARPRRAGPSRGRRPPRAADAAPTAPSGSAPEPERRPRPASRRAPGAPRPVRSPIGPEVRQAGATGEHRTGGDAGPHKVGRVRADVVGERGLVLDGGLATHLETLGAALRGDPCAARLRLE